MKAVRSVIAVVVAIVLQGMLAKMTGSARLPVDLVLVAVLTVALLYGRTAGLLAGSLAGLAQDAVSGGVLGIGGMATSLSGFLAGYAGTQFIVTQTIPRFLLYAGATVLQGVVFMGWYTALGLRHFDQPYLNVALQALVNAAIGVVLFWLIETAPGVTARWPQRREKRRKLKYH